VGSIGAGVEVVGRETPAAEVGRWGTVGARAAGAAGIALLPEDLVLVEAAASDLSLVELLEIDVVGVVVGVVAAGAAAGESATFSVEMSPLPPQSRHSQFLGFLVGSDASHMKWGLNSAIDLYRLRGPLGWPYR
jgi:hypothetical protein